MTNDKLIAAVIRGDVNAARELIRLQREGKALRLYPFGRSGPLDEGMSPVVITPSDQLMVRVHLGRYNTLLFSKESLAATMLHVMNLGVAMSRYYGDRYEEMESHSTPGLGCISHVVNGDSIALTLQPPGLLDYDLGLYHVRKLLDNWIVLIEQNEWDYADCGFSAEEYCDVLTFSDFDSEV